jgi:hypothetical protein
VAPNVISDVLPQIDEIIAALPPDLAAEDDLRPRLQLALLNARVRADVDDLERAIATLRARAGGDPGAKPFGAHIPARSYEALADTAEQALQNGDLDLTTVLELQYESGAIAAGQGRRLILFLGVNAAARRVVWEHGVAEIERRGDSHRRSVELGRWLMLWAEMSSLAISEGYRAAEREMVARDAAARRAALDEILGAASDGRTVTRLRRLAMRYGLDPDATYRVAAILPGPTSDPTPDVPGLDEADLEMIAGRIDQLLRRPVRHEQGPASGIRVPLAITWRGSIVALLGWDVREWRQVQSAVAKVLGSDPPSWIAIATKAVGVSGIAASLVELQEGIRVAARIDRRGFVDDVAELGIERLLLSDPGLAAVIVDRELGPLLADKRMGEELIETVQVFFDVGENRRETARRMHLADRTVAYRLERAATLLGHGLDGDAGRRLNLALTLRRLEASRPPA